MGIPKILSLTHPPHPCQVMDGAAAAGLDSAGFDPSLPLGPVGAAGAATAGGFQPTGGPEGEGAQASGWDVEDEYGMGRFYMSAAPQGPSPPGGVGDVPQDIAVAPEDVGMAAAFLPRQPAPPSSSSSSSSSAAPGAEAAAAAVLADLDKDYAALRGRLVALISQQQQQIQQLQQGAPSPQQRPKAEAPDRTLEEAPPAARKKSYWPPAAHRQGVGSGGNM